MVGQANMTFTVRPNISKIYQTLKQNFTRVIHIVYVGEDDQLDHGISITLKGASIDQIYH